jgi:hypothetical protein
LHNILASLDHQIDYLRPPTGYISGVSGVKTFVGYGWGLGFMTFYLLHQQIRIVAVSLQRIKRAYNSRIYVASQQGSH